MQDKKIKDLQNEIQNREYVIIILNDFKKNRPKNRTYIENMIRRETERLENCRQMMQELLREEKKERDLMLKVRNKFKEAFKWLTN
jgi:hypothetical protein